MRASCPGPQLSPGPNSPAEGEAEVAADIHSQLIDLLVQLPPAGFERCRSARFERLADGYKSERPLERELHHARSI